jgi:uncharacterized metal-binding protein
MKKTGYGSLYDDHDRQIMKIAEDSLDPRLSRIDEIIAFASESGFKRIGIANCITFEKQAYELENILTTNGFIVYRANCKLGKMANEEILPGYKGISCNPAGQAKELSMHATDMNIVMGLCLGHDMVFSLKSGVPTTTLLVKDRKLRHNTLSGFSK